jgi:hypothetical protein
LREKNKLLYDQSISKGNGLFDKALYDAAKVEFQKALDLMPDEAYPKQKLLKIAEIKGILAKDAKTSKAAAPIETPKIQELKFKDDSERDKYLKELLNKYPTGMTVEVYKEPKRVVYRYIIIRENQANDYREVQHSWGGIDYIRNDKAVTQMYFKSQVKQRTGEYFNKTEY